MPLCDHCGAEVNAEQLLTLHGENVCEPCYKKYQNPPKPCGGGPGGAQPG